MPAGLPVSWIESGGLVLDVGCHRGTFLVAMAAENPNLNFLGIERLSARVLRTNAKIQRLGLANAVAVQGGGLEIVRLLPDGVSEAVHVLFPDPWPKRRHASRRLVNREFLAECSRILRPGGIFRFVTDDASYADAVSGLLAGVDFPLVPVIGARDFPETEFQKKFREAGKPAREFLVCRDTGVPICAS